MLFVRIVSVLVTLEALYDQFLIRTPNFIIYVMTALSLVALAAIIVFCIAMRWLSTEARLLESAQSWKATTTLFVIIYTIPLGLFYAASLVAIATGESFYFNRNSVFAIVALIALFVPLIHLFISTSRMKNEAARELSEFVDGRIQSRSAQIR